MIEHYSDPKQNAFLEDGLTIESVKEKNPRVWLSYPVNKINYFSFFNILFPNNLNSKD